MLSQICFSWPQCVNILISMLAFHLAVDVGKVGKTIQLICTMIDLYKSSYDLVVQPRSDWMIIISITQLQLQSINVFPDHLVFYVENKLIIRFIEKAQ